MPGFFFGGQPLTIGVAGLAAAGMKPVSKLSRNGAADKKLLMSCREENQGAYTVSNQDQKQGGQQNQQGGQGGQQQGGQNDKPGQQSQKPGQGGQQGGQGGQQGGQQNQNK